jgi:threonyl-tRNA synthetase
MSTIQLDFNLPERFDLEYTGPDGNRHRPVMIHRALFGSIERFFGVLTEHYAGAFPMWLSPVQAIGIAVAEEYEEYLSGVLGQLSAEGLRVQLDASDDRMQKKIRNAAAQKIPVQIIAGEEDRALGAVSFRFRDGSQRNGIPVAEAIALLVAAVRDHRQIMTADDL